MEVSLLLGSFSVARGLEVMRELTKSSLEKLLLGLDQDRELAPRKYEILRLGLVRFFEWRGCDFPEEHADEVIDRVALKLDQGEEIANVSHYAIGVARLLFLEIVKQQRRQEDALRQLPMEGIRDRSTAEETRLECIRCCLQTLPVENSKLVLAYYSQERGNKIALRRKLAQGMGISSHALRMRLQRIRAHLEQCLNECLNRKDRTAMRGTK